MYYAVTCIQKAFTLSLNWLFKTGSSVCLVMFTVEKLGVTFEEGSEVSLFRDMFLTTLPLEVCVKQTPFPPRRDQAIY